MDRTKSREREREMAGTQLCDEGVAHQRVDRHSIGARLIASEKPGFGWKRKKGGDVYRPRAREGSPVRFASRVICDFCSICAD